MNFQSAGSLLWLIPLAGVIIALYLLRMTRKDYRVPATFLWPRHTEEVRANAPIQKLRFNWLLVLQLLAALLLILALAHPVSMQRGLTSDVTVFVIDEGASMGATDVSPNRLAEAKKQTEAAIASARPQDRIAVILAGPVPRVLCPLSSDHGRLTASLAGADQTDALPAMSEALRLAAALCANEAGARIVVLSDGAFPAVKDFSPGRAAVVYRKIGVSDSNLAVSALGMTDGDHGRTLYCSVTNYGHDPSQGAISLYADGKLIDSRGVQVPGEGQAGFTLPASTASHVFEAKLEAKDELSADNYAAAVADAGSHLRVLLIEAGGDPFLEKALALDPRVSLDKTEKLPDSEKADEAGVGHYDLIVFDGVPEVSVKAPATLTFGVPGPASPAAGTGRVAKPTFSTATDTPIMAGVDLQSTFIQSAALVTPRNGGVTVAEGRASDGGAVPLIITNQGAKRQVYVPFRPGDSDFPLQFAFPIFISNALDFLGGQAIGGSLVVSTGSPISFPAGGAATLTAPDGKAQSIQPVGGSVILSGLTRVGAYKLDLDGKQTTLYATLRNPAASRIAPQENLALGASEVTSTKRPARTGDLWRYGLLTALVVLSMEWVLFARRS